MNKPTTFFILITALLLVACNTPHLPQPAPAALKPAALYTLPDQYIQHRHQQQLFTSSEGKIAFTDHGDGFPMILIHGVPSSSWLYRKMIPQLQLGMRVITVDLLGYGSSDKPDSNEANYSTEQQANYVRELLNRLNIKEFGLIFHDMGGLIAWNLIHQDNIENKHQIKKIVILNTIITQDGFNHPKLKPGFMTKQLANAYSNPLTSASVLKMTFKNMGLSTNISLSENECKGYIIPMREGSNKAIYDFYTSLNQSQTFAALSSQIHSLQQYRGDSMIFWGAKDSVLTTQQLPVLRSNLDIPTQNIHIFKDNAHFLPEEVPHQLSRQILSFISQ